MENIAHVFEYIFHSKNKIMTESRAWKTSGECNKRMQWRGKILPRIE
jgi:hypothetical protein